MKNSKSNRVFRHCRPFPTLASSFIFLLDFSRAKRGKRKRRSGGKCREHIFALVDDGNDTEFSNSSPTHKHICTRARAHRHSFQSFVSRCKRSSIGVACDTASCNASPESGLKAVYTRLACASFHSRRRKRRSSEKDDGEGRNISRKGRRKSLKRNTGGSRERYIGNGDKDFRERGKKIRRVSGRHRIEENSRARRENGERKRRRG